MSHLMKKVGLMFDENKVGWFRMPATAVAFAKTLFQNVEARLFCESCGRLRLFLVCRRLACCLAWLYVYSNAAGCSCASKL